MEGKFAGTPGPGMIVTAAIGVVLLVLLGSLSCAVLATAGRA